MKDKMSKVSVILKRILESRGLGNSLSEYRILNQWQDAVGAVIAHHAQPQAMYGKKLTLTVDSTAWMQQLSLLKPEIIERVNNHYGGEVILDITLKLGELTSSLKPLEAPSVKAILSREERALVATYLQNIHDLDTRENVRRVIEKDFLNRKSKITQ